VNRPWFQQKDTKPQWEMLIDVFASQPDGWVGETAGLELAVGCAPGCLPAVVGTANRRLVSSGRRLIAVRGVGYRLATPAECLAEAAERRPRTLRRGVRRARAAAESVVSNVDATADERKRAEAIVEVHSSALRLLTKQGAVLKVHVPELIQSRRSWE